ncbi:hypothetical protein CUJ88_17385 [Paraburkholderia hospita]|uniref:Uncharacterized protein n=1 Tax=Paraburkholderia hospita TaxID=169430 RepID=A0AAN1MK39_9BURK|nr:hypothetical protein C2L64_18245 [Paraburkholderia hospita]AXF00050.1 hypothetical protein CUJ88_17385 [Paraburkholderia hospita]OUL76271.1 hypothetical protein CA603_39065 [Paraburkholderia hospita]
MCRVRAIEPSRAFRAWLQGGTVMIPNMRARHDSLMRPPGAGDEQMESVDRFRATDRRADVGPKVS